MSEPSSVLGIYPALSSASLGSDNSDSRGDISAMENPQQRIQELEEENAALRTSAESAPASAARPVGKAPRVPDPAPFNGNSNDTERFIQQVEFWARTCPDDDYRIRMTATRLTGSAAAWHLQYGDGYTIYEEYLEGLSIYFTDPRRHERAVRQLLELRQSKSVADYNRTFTTTTLRLSADRKWPEAVLIDIYLNGLGNAVRAHVEASHRPTSLEAAQRAAIVAAGEQPSSSGRPAGQQQQQQRQYQPQRGQQRGQQRDGPTPMEIGAVVQQRSGPQQRRPQRQQPGGKPWPPPHPPKTPCPVCGKGLHWAVDCPVAKAAASN